MFDRFQHWLKQLFQGETPSPQTGMQSPDFRIALTPDRPVRAQVEEALRATPHALNLAAGWLAPNRLTADKFIETLTSLADGMEYVRQRFHHVPSAICISDYQSKGTSTFFYNYDRDTIFVPRQTFDRIAESQHQLARQEKTDPLTLPLPQMFKLYGAEEAYHAYQFMAHPNKEQIKHTSILNPDGSYNHFNAIENDAEKIVREAMHDMGMPLYSIATTKNVSAHASEWLRNEQAEIKKTWTTKVEQPQTTALQR